MNTREYLPFAFKTPQTKWTRYALATAMIVPLPIFSLRPKTFGYVSKKYKTNKRTPKVHTYLGHAEVMVRLFGDHKDHCEAGIILIAVNFVGRPQVDHTIFSNQTACW